MCSALVFSKIIRIKYISFATLKSKHQRWLGYTVHVRLFCTSSCTTFSICWISFIFWGASRSCAILWFWSILPSWYRVANSPWFVPGFAALHRITPQISPWVPVFNSIFIFVLIIITGHSDPTAGRQQSALLPASPHVVRRPMIKSKSRQANGRNTSETPKKATFSWFPATNQLAQQKLWQLTWLKSIENTV